MGVEAHGISFPSDGSGTGETGMKILIKTENLKLTQVTKHPNDTSTEVYIYADGDPEGNALATGTFSGDSATFDYDFENGVEYYILTDAGGNEAFSAGGQTYPGVGTDINWTGGYRDQADTTDRYVSIVSITVQIINPDTHVVGPTGGAGTRAISKRWPVTEGDTLGSTKISGRPIALVPEQQSNVQNIYKEGLDS